MSKSPIRIIIVDDEPLARSRLRRMLTECMAQVPNVVLAEFASGQALMGSEVLRSADLVLLDIEMPGLSGIECANALSRAGASPSPSVVFTTSHAQFAVQAFDIAATDYLLKPVRLARLLEALQKVESRLPQNSDSFAVQGESAATITVSDLGRVLKIALEDILFFRAEQKFVTARTREHAYVLGDSLLDLERRFGERLVRIHRSCLVTRQNLIGFECRQVAGDRRWYAVLKDWDEHLPVSRRQMSVVKQFREVD